VNVYPWYDQGRNSASRNCKLLLAGLGFPQVPGNMVPSEAVIVKRDMSGASGTPSGACNERFGRTWPTLGAFRPALGCVSHLIT